jgi:integrase
MPRRSKGAKLWFDKDRGTYTIVDGRSRHRTGFGPEEIGRAEKALRDYITRKHKPAVSDAPLLADVIATYAEEHIKDAISGKHIQYDLRHLAKWWGTKKVTEVSVATCRAYAGHRGGIVSVRRELAFLNAAIQHWKANHAPQMATPKIKLPPKPEPRQDFMTRDEAARFLRVARRTPHLARFFLIGWYTGTRRTAICRLKWNMVDLQTGIMRRRPRGMPETKKRTPPVKVGFRLLAHLRRWHRMDKNPTGPIVHFNGRAIGRPEKSWPRVRKLAKLPAYITPHILRHSRATHSLKAGGKPWDVANALGMSLDVLLKVYGHHIPDWQADVSNLR